MLNEMKKEEIKELLRKRIRVCYEDLLYFRNQKYGKETIEAFRNILDKLILFYSDRYEISFIDACKELGVNYQDTNMGK